MRLSLQDSYKEELLMVSGFSLCQLKHTNILFLIHFISLYKLLYYFHITENKVQ